MGGDSKKTGRRDTMKKRMFLALAFVVVLSGCVSMEAIKDEVVTRVDPLSVVDAQKFSADVDDCAKYAEAAIKRHQREAIGRALAGAIVGAALGVAIGGAVGGDSTYVGQSAAVGGIVGMTAGAAGTPNWYYSIIGNCLTHRGYWLLY